jgi:predicted nucleic acid-binding protein
MSKDYNRKGKQVKVKDKRDKAFEANKDPNDVCFLDTIFHTGQSNNLD